MATLDASSTLPNPDAPSWLGRSNGDPGEPYECQQEIRLAVVMYGGVSLCIYINGVAQELLQLVRATAPKTR
ncbi:MAG TPA: hypothetical protein VNN80_02935, partial [Polyangiaceae bacterium]|nr:hypothetical protein [Polyangiaceae bacterium]